MASTTQTEHASGGSKGAAISNMVGRRNSDYTGRGPTKAPTHLHGDVVTVLRHETVTKGARSLVSDGRYAMVLSNPKAF